ncbi:MAG TPA: hypothetical protein PK916_09080 [Bacteroidota bacterium]|nr:hypothetical protein [Bacteroidota bacterium]
MDNPLYKTVMIPYNYTQGEIDDMKTELPSLLTEISVVTEQRKEVMKNYKEQLDKLNGDVKRIVGIIRRGFEEMEVDCRMEPDYHTNTMLYYIEGRLDPVYSRPLTYAERSQPELQFIKPAKEA